MANPTNYSASDPSVTNFGIEQELADNSFLLLQDGTSFLLLQDGSSKLILEAGLKNLINYSSPETLNPTNYTSEVAG